MTNVDTVQENSRPPAGGPTDSYDPVPPVVDWLIGLFAGVVGLVLTAVGVGMYTRVDSSLIAEVVTEESVDINGLTKAEFITAAGPFVEWLAVGMVVTGLMSLVGAVAFVTLRRRTRKRVAREGGTTATYFACAVYGAAVTALVSFVPGSAIAGGGAAAYLHDGDSSVRTGAAAGAVGAVLTLPMLAFVAAGFVAGAMAISELAGGALIASFVIGAGAIGLLLNVGFGGLGGYLVDRFF